MSHSDVHSAQDGGVVTITLDRAPVNAFRTATWTDLEAAFDEAAATASCRVVVLRSGLDTIFSAGADVKELPMTPERDEARQELTRRVLAKLLRAPFPIICAVVGPALGGGCAVTAACDVRLATRSASFGLPEINVGRCGGASHLMRHLSQGVVRQAYFTGEPIGAEDAWRLGLVNELFDDKESLDARAAELAATIAAKSPTALRLAKQALDLAEEMAILDGYAVEQQFSLRLATSDDAAEAAAAFKEKRPPRWA